MGRQSIQGSGSKLPLYLILTTIVIEVGTAGLLLPVLPFLVGRFDTSALMVGLLAASFGIAQFLAAPVLGQLSDVWGRRPILLFSVLGTAISLLIFGLANSLLWLFCSQILNGFSGGVISTAQAYLTDIASSRQQRTQYFGLLGAAAGIGFILGPSLGGGLALVDVRLPVFIAAGFALVNFALSWFLLPETRHPNRARVFHWRDFDPLVSLVGLKGRPQLPGLLLAYLCFSLGFAGFSNLFVVFVRDRFEWRAPQAASVLLVVGLVSTLVQAVLVRKLLPRFGELRLALLGLGLIGAMLVALCWINQGVFLYATQSLFALGVGLASPSLRGLLSQSVADSEQGKLGGVAQSLASLAQVFGPLGAGGLYDFLGYGTPFSVAAGLMGLAIVVLFLGHRGQGRTVVPAGKA